MILRTFIAVRVPGSDHLGRLLEDLSKLGRAVRPVPLQNLHLTLYFLGATQPDQVSAIANAMEASVAHEGAITATLRGLGVFPNERRPSVVWVGLADQGRLSTVQKRLRSPLETLGFELSGQLWHPHVTVARVKRQPPPGFRSVIRDHRHGRYGVLRVDSLDLLRSQLRPSGAVYSELASVSPGRQGPV